MIEEDRHGLCHGRAWCWVSRLGRRCRLHRVYPQLGGHILQSGLLSFTQWSCHGVSSTGVLLMMVGSGSCWEKSNQRRTQVGYWRRWTNDWWMEHKKGNCDFERPLLAFRYARYRWHGTPFKRFNLARTVRCLIHRKLISECCPSAQSYFRIVHFDTISWWWNGNWNVNC